ncbi:MRNA splicing protein [Aspergillus sclerotialis]|uniref:mRNA splicing protein n=1 Tax=Aspergillus sclerotialis TaxID=2070753 RepID=A0A3A2ZH51_9EURO|nr:MRNA splicing protein [Aspergillus sclerotialis]
MSERKVLTKYYPPDFDPSAVKRTPKHLRPSGPKLLTVRLMAPFSMKCTQCGEYIYRGRKFNARKETTDEKYLSISIFRFYIRWGKEELRAWRDQSGERYNETEEETLARLEREENEENEKAERDKMEQLEEKMLDSKREMAIADALDEIRTRNARIERGGALSEEAALAGVRDVVDEEREKAEKEDEEMARRAFMTDSGERVKRLVEEDGDDVNGEKKQEMPPPPSFAKVKKPKKKPMVNSLGIKKKSPLV